MAQSHYKKLRLVGGLLLLLFTSCTGQESSLASSMMHSETESIISATESTSLSSKEDDSSSTESLLSTNENTSLISEEKSSSVEENLIASEQDDQTHWGDIKF